MRACCGGCRCARDREGMRVCWGQRGVRVCWCEGVLGRVRVRGCAGESGV